MAGRDGTTPQVQTDQRDDRVPARLPEAYAHCAALVREQDQDRYIATLYAPEARRHGLFALYAFSQEIARVRALVSEPLPGEVRMQWWRDLLEGQPNGEVQGHPVAAALLDTVKRYRLPIAPLTGLIDARTFDLYDDPMPSLRDLDGYAGETSSALIRLACIVLAGGRDPGGAVACGHAGVAYALAGLMRAFPWHAAEGQVYLPADILARNGVTRDDIVRGRGGPGVLYTLKELREIARNHLKQLASLSDTIPPAVQAAFLPVALVEPYLRKMEGKGYDPYRTIITLPAWRRQWILWRAARKS
ncbi:phytoene/squalene synthase family protein [Bosea sp. SSUT16]|uniref:Phytoene/squalene synthase family protein n=1 Tax=Bosea spartocytisi TaxID=2773451 RepID=A0A927I1I6_9HYPH|nr:phytoene/squalene synthase family protein [Bosea spartocytisi]MBD3846448.1 phytoene/squalene synthase family protein [Bosea spartocytisi]MCT4471994.1 squalene/phytoene synthase family protein [Bosea spartocytisi]